MANYCRYGITKLSTIFGMDLQNYQRYLEWDCKIINYRIFEPQGALDYRPQSLLLGLILKKIIDRQCSDYRPHLFQVLFADILLQ
jgi:hypothetical protein